MFPSLPPVECHIPDKMLARDSKFVGLQISDKDVQIIKQVGRGASSVVNFLYTCFSITKQSIRARTFFQPGIWMQDCSVQVYKAYFARAGKYVAVKKIDCYERVRHDSLRD